MGLVRILDGIGNWNVIWFGNYNRDHRKGRILISNANVMLVGYWFICLEIYEVLKIA